MIGLQHSEGDKEPPSCRAIAKEMDSAKTHPIQPSFPSTLFVNGLHTDLLCRALPSMSRCHQRFVRPRSRKTYLVHGRVLSSPGRDRK